MQEQASWVARAWLPYFLAGVAWMVVGAVVLGTPNGLGLIFIGLSLPVAVPSVQRLAVPLLPADSCQIHAG
jgi:hypothetical protein